MNFDVLRRLAGCTCPPAPGQTTAARIVCVKCGAHVVARPQARDTTEMLSQDIVTYTGPDAMPPQFAITAAEAAAALSPCQKGQRGATLHRVIEILDDGREVVRETFAQGWNGPPWVWSGDSPDHELACDGSEACRRDCARRCEHAERRAIAALTATGQRESPGLVPHLLRMVHVKIGPDGHVVAGKGPSCAECARAILDAGIGGIWLFEVIAGIFYKDGKLTENPGVWRYYTAEQFHEVTMHNLGIYQVRRST